MVGDGLITLEPLEVVAYRARGPEGDGAGAGETTDAEDAPAG